MANQRLTTKSSLERREQQMSNSVSLIKNQEVKIDGWETISFTVTIPDLEQVVINAPHRWDWKTSATKEMRKFVVKGFTYDMRGSMDTLRLTQINGVFFLKGDKRAGIQETYLHNHFFSKEVIDQIPDSLLKYGRDYLADDLAPRLKAMIDTGLVIGV